jgi:hypothetical protein
MKYPMVVPAVVLFLFPISTGFAQNEGDKEFIQEATAAAPPRIASAAAVDSLEPGGKVVPVREGSNGFTCTIMPDGSNAPFCGDKNGFAWMVAAMSQQPTPPNTSPGIGYMAKGGLHYETAKGDIVMEHSAGTKEVKEPPHWMLLWPLDPAETGIPTRPNAGGSYIMFAGTPYAHLMVYQDPKMLKQ